MKKLLKVAFILFLNIITYSLLFAQEAAHEVAETSSNSAAGWAAYIGIAMAIGIPALGTGWAQARIGSAGAGTLAEKPEMAVWILILLAIPETVVILGFVIAFMLLGKI